MRHSDDTVWTEIFGDSLRVRVIECIVEHERELTPAQIAAHVDADVTPEDVQPHLDALWERGVVEQPVDGRWSIHNRNTGAQILLDLDRFLVSQRAMQADFDALSDVLGGKESGS